MQVISYKWKWDGFPIYRKNFTFVYKSFLIGFLLGIIGVFILWRLKVDIPDFGFLYDSGGWSYAVL